MNRTKALWFLVAFTVIGILTIVEGVNDGFTLLNWVVIALSVVFALQSVWTLSRDDSPQNSQPAPLHTSTTGSDLLFRCDRGTRRPTSACPSLTSTRVLAGSFPSTLAIARTCSWTEPQHEPM